MWPIRAQRLTDLIPADELRLLLSREGASSSAVTFCEATADGEVISVSADPRVERDHPDPFCTFFRHGMVNARVNEPSGGDAAFEGADAACARCEQKLARRFLSVAESREAAATGESARRRCHMGLTDSFVEIEVAGRIVGGLVAGRRVASEENRQRIRKSVGKLGKLTRAEKENFDASAHIVIRPHDDDARGRLVREIDSVPRCSDEFEAWLRQKAAFVTGLAEKRFEAFRRQQEDLVLEPALAWPDEIPRDPRRVLGDLAGQLSHLRLALGLSYLAFFARPLESLGDTNRPLALLAESGLDLPATECAMELDWSRIPPPAGPPHAGTEKEDATRGQEAVSSLIGALRATAAAPDDLKGRLTKSLFLTPVAVGSSWHGAVAFGVSAGAIEPTDADYRFLYRVGRLLVRRYYSFCLAVERTVLGRRVADLEKKLRVFEEEREKEERKKKAIPPGQRFDLRKLLTECHEKLLPVAEAKTLPIESRELADRLVIVGERRRIRDVLLQILEMGIERSCSDREGQPLSPLRLTLKRRGRNAEVAVEVIGRFLGTGEQRRLFRRKKDPAGADGKDGPSPDHRGSPPAESERAAGSEGASSAPDKDSASSGRGAASGSLRAVQDVVRDHRGRLQVRSERLHRFADDEHRWMGKTVFVVELPLPPPMRPTPGGEKSEPRGNTESRGKNEPRSRRRRSEGRPRDTRTSPS